MSTRILKVKVKMYGIQTNNEWNNESKSFD